MRWTPHHLLVAPALFFVAAQLAPQLALADHHVCSWKEGLNSPFEYGFDRFCMAYVAKTASGYADYRCAKEWPTTYGILVADFNVLSPGRLEFGELARGVRFTPTLKHDDTYSVHMLAASCCLR